MPLLAVHPSTASLLAFDDGALEPGPRRRLADHLTTCGRCRAFVVERRVLRSGLREAPQPSMPSAARTRVLTRVADGERRVLPSGMMATVEAGGTARPWASGARPRHAMTAAALLLAVAWALSHSADPLEAGASSGTLTTTQSITPTGRRLNVQYRASALLAGADSVRFEATLHPAGDHPTTRPLATALHRRRDGAFVGSVALPSDVVRATVRIVRWGGGDVDDNDARGWEVLAEDARGRPLFAALRQQFVAYEMIDWERAHQAALAMLRHYPDQPSSVRFALVGELELAGPAGADSVRRFFRPHLEALDRSVSARTTLDEDAYFEMIFLAGAMGDTTRQRQWRTRLFRDAPRSATAAQQRVFAVLDEGGSDATKLAAFERLHAEVGDAAPQLAYEAFRLAAAAGDPPVVQRWGERLRARAPYATLDVAQTYARFPSLRGHAMTVLREQLAASPPITGTDWRSALRTPTPATQLRAQALLTSLGRALLADGAVTALVAARDTLQRAAALGRSAITLRWLAQASLSTGDTSVATTAVAWTVADPRIGDDLRDSLQRALGPSASSAPFRGERRLADSAYRASILAPAVRVPIASAPQYRTLAGDVRELTAAPAGQRGAVDTPRTLLRDKGAVRVIAFVSRGCAPSLADLAALERLRRRWEPRGVPVVAMLAERPDSAPLRALAARGYKGDIGFDDRAQVARAMRQVGTPQYVVVEDGSVMRYRARSATDVGAFLEALLGSGAPR